MHVSSLLGQLQLKPWTGRDQRCKVQRLPNGIQAAEFADDATVLLACLLITSSRRHACLLMQADCPGSGLRVAL